MFRPRSCSTSCRTSRSSPPTRSTRIKTICRYQQYETHEPDRRARREGRPKKGLIWHFQGSGKSLLMVFTAQKLRMHPELGNPTVLIVVDRIDLDTQITATFNAADIPNMVGGRRAGTADAARPGRAEDHHHHDPQVRRGGRRAERTHEHHRAGGRGPPHAGRRPRAARCARRCPTHSCSA